jgi:hypothetical protein
MTDSNSNFAFSKSNYIWLGVGLVLLVTGFLLMSGGGSDDPTVFNADEIFSFRPSCTLFLKKHDFRSL